MNNKIFLTVSQQSKEFEIKLCPYSIIAHTFVSSDSVIDVLILLLKALIRPKKIRQTVQQEQEIFLTLAQKSKEFLIKLLNEICYCRLEKIYVFTKHRLWPICPNIWS